jgi:diguanylate cyclase (GGDEF)-like protein
VERPRIDEERMPRRFWLYDQFERVGWPRTTAARLVVVAFVATHLPLIALVVLVVRSPDTLSVRLALLAVLLATLAGFVGLVIAARQLLAPIALGSRALHTYIERGEMVALPTHYRDDAGMLLRDIDHTVTTFAQLRAALERQAGEDFLTGLPNRRSAEAYLQGVMADHDADTADLTIALLDLDGFKRINDRYGHEVGDEALAYFAEYLRESLPDDLVARWGGEEFLLVTRRPADEAVRVLDAIRGPLAASVAAKDAGLPPLSFSAGVTRRGPGEAIERLLARADDALYAAKATGRDRVVLAASEHDAHVGLARD